MSPSPCDRGRGTAVSSETRWAVRGVPSAHSGSPCLVGVGPLWGPGRAHPCPRPSRRPVAARSTGKDRSSAALAVSAPAPCPSTSSSPCGESESREGGVPSCPPPRLVLLWPGPSLWVRPAWGSRQLGPQRSAIICRAWGGTWHPRVSLRAARGVVRNECRPPIKAKPDAISHQVNSAFRRSITTTHCFLDF